MRILLPFVIAVATLALSQEQAIQSNGYEESRALLAAARGRRGGGGGGGGRRSGGGGGGGGRRSGGGGGGGQRGGVSLRSVGRAAIRGSGFSAHSIARAAGQFAGSAARSYLENDVAADVVAADENDYAGGVEDRNAAPSVADGAAGESDANVEVAVLQLLMHKLTPLDAVVLSLMAVEATLVNVNWKSCLTQTTFGMNKPNSTSTVLSCHLLEYCCVAAMETNSVASSKDRTFGQSSNFKAKEDEHLALMTALVGQTGSNSLDNAQG
ncbi:hypothetical protein AC1031_012478 [Aphanomyces cochlioides]|nr:hypothetical protein AC1031_012478 [Aphanomyces cochlioides]